MRRYGFSLGVLLVILAGMITLLIVGVREKLPSYKLVTLDGNEAEGRDIRIMAYDNGRDIISKVDINSQGSSYPRAQSFLGQIMKDYAPNRNYSGTRHLVKDYPSFMRGTYQSNGSIYEDEDDVIYAEVSNKEDEVEGKIKWLNKKSGKTKSFDWNLKVDPILMFAHLLDVQKINNQVHLLLLNQTYGLVSEMADNSKKSPNIYTDYKFDLSDGRLLSQKELSLNHNFDMKLEVDYEKSTVPSSYTVMRIGDSLYSYNYKNGEFKEVPEVKHSRSMESYDYQPMIMNDHFYQFQHIAASDSIIMTDYNLQTNRVDHTYTITAGELGGSKIKRVMQQNGRLYVLLQTANKPIVVTVDPSTGQLLYKGEIQDTSMQEESYERVSLFNIYVY